MDKYTATEMAFKHGYEKGYEAGIAEKKKAYCDGLLDGRRAALECVLLDKWIPVSERLPEEFVSVIVCIPCEHPLPMVKEAYLANGFWATKMAIFSEKDVTHWMPLPEPPQEG